MSLTTASAGAAGLGGAGGASGLSMAQNAHAMARPMAAQPPPETGVPPSAGMALPPNMAGLAADLLDKHQSLSLKQMRNLSRYPIVAVDIYGKDPHVAMFPPKPSEPSTTLRPSVVGKLKSQVALKTSETAHKTLRKWLTKSKGYTSLLADSLGHDGVCVERPHQLLGVRRLKDVPEFVRDSFPSVESGSPTHAIAEESHSTVGVTVANGTLDGVSAPTGDDFDRVVYKVRLHESKKALTILPEEATALIFATAQSNVARKTPKVDEDNEDEALEYPISVALPGWACHDAAVEAVLDATGGSGVLFQRSVAALAGALQPGSKDHPSVLLDRLNQVRTAKQQEFQRENPKETTIPEYKALIVLAGFTGDGVECTAVQVSSLQPKIHCCLFGDFNVLANVSYQHSDPASHLNKCVEEIYSNLEKIAPEADGPIGFVTYGSSKDQGTIKTLLEELRTTLDTWEKVPVFSTKADCVAMGLAVLGGVSHGRLATFIHVAGKKKPKAQLALRVQNVATTAVGIRMNYYGGAANKWEPIKVIFDFDRRVPAGPYPIELTAAECAAIRASKIHLSDDVLLAAIKEQQGAKAIPQRETAALNLRIQVLQKYTRDGEWMNVGDVMSPLVKIEGDEDDETKVACEEVLLELSVGSTGLISRSLSGDRESVVQAVATARNSKLRYYIGIVLAVAFFGGLFVKSFVEERILEHDTNRVLAYYKHTVPGSFSDGDRRNAMYLAYKYRGKKEKLWRRLEAKYGEPVLTLHEYEEIFAKQAEAASEEANVEDLDDAAEPEDNGRAEPSEEPDL